MRERLQVRLDERDLREIKRRAREQNMTVADWVRQALRAATQRDPLRSTADKLAAVRAAARRSFPTGPIDQMLKEIERFK